MSSFEDMLQHDGVKGMKWGVVKWRKVGGASGKPRAPGRMKQEWDSLKRERHWKRTVGNIDQLSTKKIGDISRRISLENDLKRLSKSGIGTAKDKKDYRLRGNMSEQELNRKVTRLRVKSGLSAQINTASKEQREVGKKITNIGGSLLMSYAVNKKISVGDVYESVQNPNAAKTKAVKTLMDLTVSKIKDRAGR